jgi:5,10-methylenetetrahydrofolate reductase
MPANMHLTCNTMTRAEIVEVLNKTKDKGIRNILALRGGKLSKFDLSSDRIFFVSLCILLNIAKLLISNFCSL